MIAKYKTASQRLLSYAELNREDSRFDRGKGQEIIYILDTSVVEAYWRRRPESIGGHFGTDALLEPKVAQYSGWLALKFLMEHRLPGQRSESAFVSADHWNETLDRLGRLAIDTREDLKNAAAQEGLLSGGALNNEKFDLLLGQLLNVEKPEARLKEAHRLGVGRTFLEVMQAVSRGERVRRTFRTGRTGNPSIRDLTFCSAYSELEGPKFRHLDFRRWQSVITKHRLRYEREANRSGDQRLSRNIDSDAVTLACIQNLYRNNADQALPSGKHSEVQLYPKLKFVFVTADAAIHDAFSELRHCMDDEGIPFFLRHPHVYAPLLNHANMTQSIRPRNFDELRQVFNRVEEALETMSSDFDLQSPLMQGYDRKLQYNISLWSRNVDVICLANSHYVLSDASGEYAGAAELARILSTPDVREAAATSVSSDLALIRDDHLQMLSMLAWEKLEDAREYAPTSPREHRAPVKLIEVNIAEELGYPNDGDAASTTWLDTLLADFRSIQDGTTPDQVIDKLRALWEDNSHAQAALLLASCIFFAVNEWDHAKLCAQLCQKRIRKKRNNLWLREARYCEALAIRMQLRSRDELRHATDLLTYNIADFKNPLAIARDTVERATINLTAIALQMIEIALSPSSAVVEQVLLVPLDEVRDKFEEYIIDLQDQRTMLEQCNPQTPDLALMAMRIKIQAEVNLLGAHIFAHLLGDVLIHESHNPDAVPEACAALERTLGESPFARPASAEIYLIVSEAICVGTPKAAHRALERLRPFLSEAGALSTPDDVENRFLIQWLEQRAHDVASAA